jgi:hypothetical protein
MIPDPPPVGSMALYDAVTPAIDSGTYRVTSTVSVPAALATSGANVVHRDFIAVGGSPLRIASTDIISCHPPRNATGAFDQELPHVVLGRRTLPWERPGPTNAPPWLALLVFLDSEVTFASGTLQDRLPGLVSTLDAAPTDPVDVVTVNDPTVLAGVLPAQAELGLLSHVRRVNTADTALDLDDDDGWMAVVVANRLPLATDPGPARYHACLVSLEHRGDVYVGGSSELILLYRWDFVTDSGGTFEELADGLNVDTLGNTAVTDAAGRATIGLTEREGAATTALYRGPFTVTDAALADDDADADISYDAAYELGRLLGAADPTLCRELVAWHRASLTAAQTATQTAPIAAASARLAHPLDELADQPAHVRAAAAGLAAMLRSAAPAAPQRLAAPRRHG